MKWFNRMSNFNVQNVVRLILQGLDKSTLLSPDRFSYNNKFFYVRNIPGHALVEVDTGEGLNSSFYYQYTPESKSEEELASEIIFHIKREY